MKSVAFKLSRRPAGSTGPGELISVGPSVRKEGVREAAVSRTAALIEAEAPYLSSDHVYVHFTDAYYGGGVAGVQVAVFGGIDKWKLIETLPEFSVLRHVEIDLIIYNEQTSGASAVHLFGADDRDGEAAYNPTLAITYNEMDLRIQGVTSVADFTSRLAQAIDESYHKITSVAERHAEGLLVDD